MAQLKTKEAEIEKHLIEVLQSGEGQWKYRPDIKSEDDLWKNIQRILNNRNLDKLDGISITDEEMEQIKMQPPFIGGFYETAEWLVGDNGVAHVSITRNGKKISLVAFGRYDVACNTTVYEVVNQITVKRSGQKDRRLDVTLLINGLPMIHIELKSAPGYKEAFTQIEKYVSEGIFTGVLSTVQVFIAANNADLRYFAANTYLNESFTFNWKDSDGKPVGDIITFASDFLRIPFAHNLVTDYTLMESQERKLIVLRYYQINAIKAINDAASLNQSGFIWHTTGSGKTMTSYKVAHNLLNRRNKIDKVIFIVDRIDLDNQTSTVFRRYAQNDALDIDNTKNTSVLIEKLSEEKRQVIVTTIQKIQAMERDYDDLHKKLMNNNLKPYEEKRYKMLKKIKDLKLAFIVDECHRAVSPREKRNISRFFKQETLWYGFTGTPRINENPYDENADLPRTTETLYGPVLHKYTITDAIDDKTVLDFQIDYYDEGEVPEEYYESKSHMLNVLDIIINKCQLKFGMGVRKPGDNYEAILTVKSIEVAKKYYVLLKQIKNGEEPSVMISDKTKSALVDFPRFAITYSASVDSNKDDSKENNEMMSEAIDDYNEMFGTSFSVENIQAYNNDLGMRLKRDGDRYKERAQQLDIIIVVKRLLTGFDAPYISTLFIDKQPSKPHDIIQMLSRTNRLLDKKKSELHGQIVTFQTKDVYKIAIEKAFAMYGGLKSNVGEPFIRSIDDAYELCTKYLTAVNEIAPTTDAPLSYHAPSEKLEFINKFKKFYHSYTTMKSYCNYDEFIKDNPIDCDDETVEKLLGHYNNLCAELKRDKPDILPADFDSLNFEMVKVESVIMDYYYIIDLIKRYCNGEEQSIDIKESINNFSNTNEKLGEIVKEVYEDILSRDTLVGVDSVEDMIEAKKTERINELLYNFAEEWCVDRKTLTTPALRYTIDRGFDGLGFDKIKGSADYNKYKETHGTALPPFKYYTKLKESLKSLIETDILPIRDNNYTTNT